MHLRKTLGAAGLLSLFAALHPVDASSLRAPEAAIETLAGALIVPANVTGEFLVPPCRQCPPRAFRAAETVELKWNGQRVALADFRRRVLANPRAAVTVFYRRADGVLLRVIGHE
ncbi:MAG: hypothetical protein NZM12_10385 [Steroidobacteraceae bacterium]|nr:hypothetical protein [Steroidobacteraceae bacterium]MDW8260785.1 hypothetical protein [Gammaproteobacteria bacterium]